MVVVLALSTAFCGPAPGAEPATMTPAATARALFDEYWEWVLREDPAYATYLGDHRYDDRLADESAAGGCASPRLLPGVPATPRARR